MPLYEYRCRRCEKQFDVTQSVHAREEDTICPFCQAQDATRLLSSFVSTVASAVPIPWLVALVVCLAAGFGLWFVIRRRQRPAATPGEVVSESFGAWKEATCPICLALGTRERIGKSVGTPRKHA